MDPAFQLCHLDPANNFAMGGLNMAFARELLLEGKPLPKTLFLDVMVEKTQILIEHIKNPPSRTFFNCKHWQEYSSC